MFLRDGLQLSVHGHLHPIATSATQHAALVTFSVGTLHLVIPVPGLLVRAYDPDNKREYFPATTGLGLVS